MTDPMNVPDITQFLVDILKATPEWDDYLERLPKPTRPSQSLERLPNEILDRICEYLPPSSVICLHETSKALAYKVPLDDRFWRLHLRDGTMLPHLWDLDTEQLNQLQRYAIFPT